ncbi:unnamed protein product [Prorocentrum cordatum]|uniref:Sulfhydryl oxidase n=1 Tax=Prorocentrum cordatum TaxID=2364126 RepID=A0ABN9X742_9DINO|nr:unnamed protein product [Polarella glacialis]
MPAGLLALLLAAAPAACIQLQAGGHGGVARGLSDERCSAPLQSDACYEMVYRAMRHDIARHPELYPRLASSRFSLGDMRALGRGWPSRRGWEELADSCEPCGAPEQERAPIGAAMRLHKAGCHTAVAGEACHREVTWAMQHGIVERPRWYQRLSSNSSFEEFQAFVHDVDTFYRLCPAPCAAHDGAPAQRGGGGGKPCVVLVVVRRPRGGSGSIGSGGGGGPTCPGVGCRLDAGIPAFGNGCHEGARSITICNGCWFCGGAGCWSAPVVCSCCTTSCATSCAVGMFAAFLSMFSTSSRDSILSSACWRRATVGGGCAGGAGWNLAGGVACSAIGERFGPAGRTREC